MAVSGGVDSMVLLDLLAEQPEVELIVAHFNHGIRPDSQKDEALVGRRAKRLGLKFEAGYGRLGRRASEETARNARYEFLYSLQEKYQIRSVITAHHQDDLIETALLNLLRGTGRQGLAAISSNKNVTRPLLSYSKREIKAYAAKNQIEWREDATNSDNKYLRNRLRSSLVNLTDYNRQELVKNIDKVAKIEAKLKKEIASLSQYYSDGATIDRASFNLLPAELADELVVDWLRRFGAPEFDRKTVNRVSLALRTAKPNTVQPVRGDVQLKISRKTAQFSHTV